MKLRTAACVLAVTGLTVGCAGSGLNMDGLTSGAGKMFAAYNMSDAEIKTLSDQACAEADKDNKPAAKGSKYDARLQKIVQPISQPLNGVQPNFKVYQVQEVNAWAMANGCIRVYAGLMDKMTDAEVRGVIAHEMAHVDMGHSKSAMQTAYTVSAARELAASTGNAAVTALTASQAGDLAEKFINAQYSQKQETEADNYAYDLLKAKNQNPEALVTAFNKLAALDGGGSSSMLSSHPASGDRAANIQARINADKK